MYNRVTNKASHFPYHFYTSKHFDDKRILYEKCESFTGDLAHVYPDLD